VATKTKKKAAKKKDESKMTIELDGKIYLVDYQPGKKPVKTEIDGRIVLQLVLQAIIAGIDSAEREEAVRNGL
jgi:hypothetical protein